MPAQVPGNVRLNELEKRSKKYAPVQDVADKNVRSDAAPFWKRQQEIIDRAIATSKHIPKSKAGLLGQTQFQNPGVGYGERPDAANGPILSDALGKAIAPAYDLASRAFYRGRPCPKCKRDIRQRGTGACFYCVGPPSYQSFVNEREERKRVEKAQKLSHKEQRREQRKKEKAMLSPDTVPMTARNESINHTVSLAVHHGAVYQATIRVPRQMWADIGYPKKVDITSPMYGAWIIKPGDMTVVSAKREGVSAILLQIACKRLNIPKTRRKAVNLDARISGNEIMIDAPPWGAGDHGEQPDYNTTPEPETRAIPWSPPPKGAPEPEPEIATEEAARILDSNKQLTPGELIGEVSLTTIKTGMGDSLTLNMSVPLALLGGIGDPKRVIISGTAFEGFKIKPAFAQDGILVNYKTGNNIYLTYGLKRAGLEKHRRKGVKVHAEIAQDPILGDNIIKVSGPPYEWSMATPQWRPEPNGPPPKPEIITPKAAAISNGNGAHMSGNGHHHEEPRVPSFAMTAPQIAEASAPPVARTGAAIKNELQAKLLECLRLKNELEAATGFEFRVIDFRLVVK